MPQRKQKKLHKCKKCGKLHAFYYRDGDRWCSKNCFKKYEPKEEK